MLSKDELRYWAGFSRIPGIGKARFTIIKDYFGSLANAWIASALALRNAGLDDATISSIVQWRSTISPEAEMEAINKYGVRILTYDSPGYPKLLIEAGDFPPVLYIRGDLTEQDDCSLAVVGTRRATAYGRQVTEEVVSDLARLKITIVSGLAKGIDTVAHRAALNSKGRTLAVFASGLDIVYPPENVNLAREIMENGALVSEYPLGTKPKAEHFPRRNRILSGLSRGVLIVESGDASGALITANFALEQDREVFAIPGSVFSSMSRGPNKLIQEGAKLVRNYIDVIEELNLSVMAEQLEMKETAASNSTESLIMKCIGEAPVHIDEICRISGLNTSSVSSAIAIMELKGTVRNLGNMCYALNKSLR